MSSTSTRAARWPLRTLREHTPAASDDDFVICAADGAPLHPDRLSQLFRKHVRHSGLRRIRLHDLRHTHASLMLRVRIPLKVVSERLGHADPGFTMRVYQHVLPGMQAAAARAFAELIVAKPADSRPM